MNWPLLFLGCFVIGFVSSVVSFALSARGLHVHLHFPTAHHLQGVHAPDVWHIAHAGSGLSPINFATLTAFLAWFGGVGYLLTSEFRWLVVPALFAAVAAGVVGAAVVFWVMVRVLWSPKETMLAADSHMVGVLGRLTHAIRADGIGELVYSQGGTRQSCGAKSVDGLAIEKGAEVVVTAYERGIAHVKRWEDLAADRR